jgi:hypothetical protein
MPGFCIVANIEGNLRDDLLFENWFEETPVCAVEKAVLPRMWISSKYAFLDGRRYRRNDRDGPMVAKVYSFQVQV